MAFRIVSYNIHSGVGLDGRFDLFRIAEVLHEVSADFIALQECGDFLGRTSHDAHPETLASILKMDMAFGPNVVRDGRRYGNAILSRWPILHSQNYDLSHGRREPRGALRCDVGVEGRSRLHLFSVHLGLSVTERRAQEWKLFSNEVFQEASRAEPLVVCGDFNYLRGRPAPAMLRHSINDAARALGAEQKTYPSRFPILRLDRIFIDRSIRPLSLHVHKSAMALKSSDHLPVVMEFEALPQAEEVRPALKALAS